jgi:hypothetical protein
MFRHAAMTLCLCVFVFGLGCGGGENTDTNPNNLAYSKDGPPKRGGPPAKSKKR